MKKLLWLTATVCCLAAEPAVVDVKFLLGLASAAPAEIAADAKLRIAEVGAGLSVDDREKLIEEAFVLAAGAQLPYRRVPVDGVGVDTGASFQAAVSALGLDRMSLEQRAVTLLFRHKPAKAQELFARMARPSLATPGCEAGLIPDPSAYWETAGLAAARSGANAAARFESLVASIESIADLPPAAGLLNATRLDADAFDAMLGVFASKLESVPASYRAFAHTDTSLRAALEQLIARANRANLPVTRLAHAYRRFLTNNLTAERCADKPQIPRLAADWFNTRLKGELPDFDPSTASPSSTGGSIRNDEVWSGDQNERVRQLVHQLRISERGVVLSSTERGKPEWRIKLAQLVNELNSWRPAETTAFHQKATVLQALVELAPPGDDRALLLKEFVGFMGKSSTERSAPADWYSQVRQLHQRLTLAGDVDASHLLDAYRDSGNSTLALYAMLANGRYRPHGLF